MEIIETKTIVARLSELVQWNYNEKRWETTSEYDKYIDSQSWTEPITLKIHIINFNDPLAITFLVHKFCEGTGGGKIIIYGSYAAEFEQIGVAIPMP